MSLDSHSLTRILAAVVTLKRLYSADQELRVFFEYFLSKLVELPAKGILIGVDEIVEALQACKELPFEHSGKTECLDLITLPYRVRHARWEGYSAESGPARACKDIASTRVVGRL